jgi:hypothetical protein
MFDDEFYADPTVFDQWQRDTGNWIGRYRERVLPFSWAIGFGALAAGFLTVAVAVPVDSLQHATSAGTVTSWNSALAAGVTFLIASTASIGLFRHAADAWPASEPLLDAGGKAAGLKHSSQLGRTSPAGVSARPRTGGIPAVDRQAIQEFFAGVRNAGVNVSIAKALFAAGVRSVQHLQQVEDSYLHGIRGVGPATVRKLRAHFAQA